MTEITIGMLGAGFIGQMHSLSFGSVGRAKARPQVFGRLVGLVEHDAALAAEVQRRYGWERVSADPQIGLWNSAMRRELKRQTLPMTVNRCETTAAWRRPPRAQVARIPR